MPLARYWELCEKLTIYDASYVALAEIMDVTLLTGDGRLVRATAASLPHRGASVAIRTPTGPGATSCR